jgi:hypothetical protein
MLTVYYSFYIPLLNRQYLEQQTLLIYFNQHFYIRNIVITINVYITFNNTLIGNVEACIGKIMTEYP